ncbi:kinesin [Thraustotheca clavata]|uniref:Kinesin n=1 Tax=Thraustotheca clavata TaxID=74557 RepID=A0A1V9ZE84_9STRA|nr:kinesin [Thraustotheca clavata]
MGPESATSPRLKLLNRPQATARQLGRRRSTANTAPVFMAPVSKNSTPNYRHSIQLGGRYEQEFGSRYTDPPPSLLAQPTEREQYDVMWSSSFLGIVFRCNSKKECVIRRIAPNALPEVLKKAQVGDVLVAYNEQPNLAYEQIMEKLRNPRYPVTLTFAPPSSLHPSSSDGGRDSINLRPSSRSLPLSMPSDECTSMMSAEEDESHSMTYEVVWNEGTKLGVSIIKVGQCPCVKERTELSSDPLLHQIQPRDQLVSIQGANTIDIGYQASIVLLRDSRKPVHLVFRRLVLKNDTREATISAPPTTPIRESQYALVWESGPLGLTLKKDKIKNELIVSKLSEVGLASRSNLISIGDILISISDVNVNELGLQGTMAYLKAAPKPTTLVFHRVFSSNLDHDVRESLSSHESSGTDFHGDEVALGIPHPLSMPRPSSPPPPYESIQSTSSLHLSEKLNSLNLSPQKQETRSNCDAFMNSPSKSDPTLTQAFDNTIVMRQSTLVSIGTPPAFLDIVWTDGPLGLTLRATGSRVTISRITGKGHARGTKMQPAPVLYEKYEAQTSSPADLASAGASQDVVVITCKGGARLLVSKRELEALKAFLPKYEDIDVRRLMNALPMLIVEMETAAKAPPKPLSLQKVRLLRGNNSSSLFTDPQKEAENRIHELETQLSNEKMNVERYEYENLTLKETLLRKERAEHEAAVATTELNTKLYHTKKEMEEIQTQSKQDLDQVTQKYHNECHDLTSTLTAQREELAAKLNGEMDELNTKLNGEIDELNTKLNGEIDELNTKLKALLVVANEKDQVIATQNTTIDNLTAELAQTNATLDAANKTIQDNGNDIASLHSQYASQGSLLSQVESDKRAREENIVELTEQLQTVQAKANSLFAHTQGLVSELKEMRQELLTEAEDMQQYVTNAMESVMTESQDREKVLYDHLQRETLERKRMTEKYHEVSGKIRVFCRIRPLKVETNEESAYMYPKPQTLLVASQRKEFVFDQIYGPESTQEQVYEHIDPLVGSVMDGYNACVMAYGQTGAGKTYSMVGESTAPGIIPRALQQLFEMSTARQLICEDRISISMQEIYNDQPRDLLSKDILTSKDSLETRQVYSWEEVQQVLDEGHKNRSVASTKMNIESSRSHAIIFVYVQSSNRQTLEKKNSTLCLVDLAGSERISRTQVTGDRLKEAQHINKSLSTLGDVVHALQHKAKHVPYRNSKLTFTLRDMLSGGAKALMMLQVSPDVADVGESICSLQFGARVSQVELGAAKQTSVESGELLSLKDELAKQKDDSEKEITRLRTELEQLREELETRSNSFQTTLTAGSNLSSKASNQSGDDEPEEEWKRFNTDSEPEPETKKRAPRGSFGSTSSRLSSVSSKSARSSSTPAAPVPKPTSSSTPRAPISRRFSLPTKPSASSVTAPTAASVAAAVPSVRAKVSSSTARLSRHSIGTDTPSVRQKITTSVRKSVAPISSPPPRKWV